MKPAYRGIVGIERHPFASNASYGWEEILHAIEVALASLVTVLSFTLLLREREAAAVLR